MTTPARFWQRVKTGSDDACWEWQACRIKYGYGQLRFNGKNFLAHRVAYLLTKGELTPGLSVMHTCDNPPCCNPRHLILAPHAENMRDAKTKGRMTADHLKPFQLAGQGHNSAKLTDEDVLNIRASKKRLQALAKRYGISRMTVHRIRRNLAWRHIPINAIPPDARLAGLHGSEHGRAVLTEDDVRVIRSTRERPSVLARKYGVNQSVIFKVRSRETWRHTP